MKDGEKMTIEEIKSKDKKTYYEIQLDALNSIDKLKDKKEFCKKIDFSKKIEKDIDAQIIKDIQVFAVLPLKEGEDKRINIDIFFDIDYNKKGEEIERKVNIENVAKYLISKYNFATWFGTKSDYSFKYDGKIFKQETRGFIKTECEKLLKEYCKRYIVDEIFEKVKRKSKVDKEEFEKTDINFIPLMNGIWDIENKKLIPHDPKCNFQFIIPQIYTESAKCPSWLKFINETLYPEDVSVMQEWFGFILYREYFIKKAVICEGEQDTGKSVVLDTVIKFIGELNKTGLSLQKISSGSDFTKLSLKNKHANIYDDLSSSDLNDGGAFKVATGGGYISGEEKFGEYHQFKSFAKQMFATNKIPPVKDNDDLAYFGRYIVFKFDNVPENKDPFLRRKLWTQEEMSGILNWALEGLYRLLEKGEFNYKKTPIEIKQIMEISGCPLVAFSSEVLTKEDGNIISKDNMYKVYSIWCDKTKRPRLSKEMLGRKLTKYCGYIISDKHKERIWKNARINGNWEVLLKNVQNTLNYHTSDTLKKHMSCNENRYTYNGYGEKSVGSVGNKSPKETKSHVGFEKEVSEVSEIDPNKKPIFTDEEIKSAGHDPKEIRKLMENNK